MGESGTWAPGVTVKFTNSSNSITTKSDGTFQIFAPNLPDTLIFSAPGYEPYSVIITEKNIKDPNFEVVLLNKREMMDEVVVSSSPLAKRSMTTGSVTHMMAGKTPGVTVRGLGSGGKRRDGEVKGLAAGELGKTFGYVSGLTERDSLRITQPRSRILTAGEVNDFTKWKRWSDYSEGEFKEHSAFWGMFPVNRYTVQLIDKNGNAAVNERVYLLSKYGADTIFRAVSDNTGKAELWASFLDKNKGEEYIIADAKGNKVKRPTTFENGINFIEVDRQCMNSKSVDIAFVVDATGSMGDEIEFLKLELEDVINRATKKYADLDLYTASVFYRDKGDEYLTRHSGFSDNVLKALNFIKLQKAGGGGDFPEALDVAMEVALDSLNWNAESRTRLLFLLLDAPSHETGKRKLQQVIFKAAAMGVRIIPIGCSGIDKSTEFLMRSMALATNGSYAFLTDHSGVGNSHIEPTTDKYDVEILNSLMERLIDQFIAVKDCNSREEPPVVSNEKQPAMKIFPNPTSGNCTIESTEDIEELFVADFTGKILMRLANNKGRRNWRIDLGQFPSGTYLVKYVSKEKRWETGKVVVLK